MEMSIGAAKVALVNLQVNVEMAVSVLKSVKDGMPANVRPYIKICTNNEDDDCAEPAGITGISTWVLQVDDLPPDELAAAVEQKETFEEDWENFKEQFAKAEQLLKDFVKAKEDLDALEDGYEQFVTHTVATINKAKEAMKDVLTSPFLLPGLWAAMIPSMIPYFGGLMPPPFPGGPPSTIPGMIYLLLLFLDAWEEFQAELADESAVEDEFDCDDLL
jgi:hypothetical protein